MSLWEPVLLVKLPMTSLSRYRAELASLIPDEITDWAFSAVRKPTLSTM